MGVEMNAQSYDELWKKIELLERDDKPKSIISVAEQIYAKAEKEGCFAQMLKAKTCIIEGQCNLDPELFAPDEYEKILALIEADKSLDKDERAARLAITHSILASAYNEMRDSYVVDFDQETQEDYPKKAKEHILAAVSDMETLCDINDEKYHPAIELKDDSRLFNHSLLFPILERALESGEIILNIGERMSLYERAIKAYEKRGMKDACVLLRLRTLRERRYAHEKAWALNDEQYKAAVKDLVEQSWNTEAGIDVAEAYLETMNYDSGRREDIAKLRIARVEKAEYVRRCIDHWKDYERVSILKNIETELMATRILAYADANIIAGKPFALNIKYENAEQATITIREYAGKTKHRLNETGKIVVAKTHRLAVDELHGEGTNKLPTAGYVTDSITLPAGRYVIISETEGARDVREYSLSSIRAVSVALPGNNTRIVVLDNITGRPVAGATLMGFEGWNTEYGQTPAVRYKTDRNGEVILKDFKRDRTRNYLVVRDESSYGTPKEDVTNNLYINYAYISKQRDEHTIINAYTDRSLYRPGQTVHLTCIAYTQKGDSIKVCDGKKFNILVRDPNGKEIFKGEQLTNEMGSLSFEVELPEECKLGNYRVECDGWGCYGSTSFHIEEYKRPTFEVLFDEKQKDVKHTLGESFSIAGSAMMFSGVPTQGATVVYTVEWAEERHWYWRLNYQALINSQTTTDDEGCFHIDMPKELPNIVTADSIIFRVKADVTDINGEMQHGEFIVKVKNPDYKETDKENEDEGPKDELKVSVDEISERQDAIVTFTSKERDALVYYYIASKNKIEQQGTKVLNGGELKFTVKYKKEWGDGVYVGVFYVRNGHYYHTGKPLPYVRPDKKLHLAWSTFRDNLTPGQQEEWTLTVKDKNGHTMKGAELAAVMYDSSLDNIYPHMWDMAINFERNIPSYHANITHGNNSIYLHLEPEYDLLHVEPREFDVLTNFTHHRWYRTRSSASKSAVMYSAMPVQARAMAKNGAMEDAAFDEMEVSMLHENKVVATAESVEEAESTSTQSLRTNLNELAFFYPHLTTDANGEAHIAFTLPDCLTEWKFMGIVHTQNMDYGTITAKATAKKDFMVQPNMPRFLRTGDKAVINAKIINLSGNVIKGTATLRILDAATEKVLMQKPVEFAVDANQSAPVAFAIDAPINNGEYICEITATDGIVSDGERNRLPVLSTKVNVVENIPFYLDGASTKVIDLSTLYNNGSNTATDKKIEIGYTDNPALPVFQSLKALQNPQHDNAPCYAASLYSNLVMLDMSKVLGNRITDFNAKEAKKTADKAVSRLKKLQRHDGAWSWFEGMDGNFYITLTVAEHLHRLQAYFERHAQKCPEEVSQMLKKALAYLDAKELKEYKERKEHKWSLRPYDTDLRYLSIATDADAEMLNTYLTEMVKDFKNLTIYGRAEGAVILNKYGRELQAQRFIDSVKEYTVYKEGFGRYFATDQAYYSWMDYRIPTQLAAMRAIQDKTYLLDMQLWLLRQKQTQTWDNPINALDIADFLLTNDRETSLHEVTTPTLVLDGNTVEKDTIYSVKDADALSVTKTSPGISWGHVRGTFQEEVSNLHSYTSGELTIERKVIRNGNKVTIRHILHADRDMDFVSVMSQHAACLEPLRTLSGYQWMGGRGCYLEVHDSHINLFFDKFTRGTTTIDMDYYIAREGEYNSGYASIECSYAPEFGAHTSGEMFR